MAQRASGRLASMQGAFAEAQQCLNDALRGFRESGISVWATERLVDLAGTAAASGDRKAAIEHFETAKSEFNRLQTPPWTDIVDRVTAELRLVTSQ